VKKITIKNKATTMPKIEIPWITGGYIKVNFA
jgi:hypothetical protein